MTITKVEAEQLFELTEPYTKTDLKKAARRAIKKWHPDMAARNGIDPAVAAAQYGKIAESEKYLVGFFDGKPDDYKETPSSRGTSAPSNAQTNRSTAQSTNTKRTRRATTRNTTSTTSSSTADTRSTTARSAANEAKSEESASTGGSKGTRYWDSAAGNWKIDPTGKREGWYEGEDPGDEQEPARERRQRPPRRPSEPGEPNRRARATHANGADEAANPRPHRQSFTQQESPQQEVADDLDDGPSTIPEYLHRFAMMGGKIRRGILIFATVAFLLSAESAVRHLDLSSQPIWFAALLFVTPLSFLLAGLSEFGFGLFSNGICASLETFATALDNDNPFAKAALLLLRVAFTILRALYKIVGWGLNRILGS